MKKIAYFTILVLIIAIGNACFAGDWIEVKIKTASIPPGRPDGKNWDAPIEGAAPDPYITVFVNDRLILKTSIKQDTSEPEWNALATFESSYHDDSVEIRLYDADVNWAEMAVQLQDRIELDQNLQRIQRLLAGDDLITKATIQLKESHFRTQTPMTIWMVKDKEQGIFFEIRPGR